MANKYDENNIKSLSSLEHIRLRPGMYIGRLGNGSHVDDGIYIYIYQFVLITIKYTRLCNQLFIWRFDI